jgi:hypothetical protein
LNPKLIRHFGKELNGAIPHRFEMRRSSRFWTCPLLSLISWNWLWIGTGRIKCSLFWFLFLSQINDNSSSYEDCRFVIFGRLRISLIQYNSELTRIDTGFRGNVCIAVLCLMEHFSGCWGQVSVSLWCYVGECRMRCGMIVERTRAPQTRRAKWLLTAIRERILVPSLMGIQIFVL